MTEIQSNDPATATATDLLEAARTLINNAMPVTETGLSSFVANVDLKRLSNMADAFEVKLRETQAVLEALQSQHGELVERLRQEAAGLDPQQ